MTSRERVLAALAHHRPDRTPRVLYGELIGYVPAVERLLSERCAGVLPRRYFNMDMTGVYPNPTTLGVERFMPWFDAMADRLPEEVHPSQSKSLPPAQLPVDEWGVWWRQGGFHHFAHIESPLYDIDSPSIIETYPWPDIDADYRYQGLAGHIGQLHDEGVAVAAFVGSIFEQAWYLRGMENLIEDMMLRPDIAHRLMDRTAYYQKQMATRMAHAGVDMIMFGDDVAMQTGLMMSVATWRTFLKPRLADAIADVRAIRDDIHVFYHSDGNLEPLIPELIEIGVNVLNPIQPECMDAAAIRQTYGQALSFLGTISVQQTMPFGTPEQVRTEVQQRIDSAGRNGGLILAPAHVLEPEVPWDNIVAFFEAADMLL